MLAINTNHNAEDQIEFPRDSVQIKPSNLNFSQLSGEEYNHHDDLINNLHNEMIRL